MTPEERFERIEAALDRMAAQQEQAQKEHQDAMREIYTIVTQIGQQTLIIGQRLTELINALRHGERNGSEEGR